MSRDLIFVALALGTWGVGEGMFLYFEPIYLQQLGADPILIGSILGGVGLVMAISYIPAGFLTDRYGRRPLLHIAWLWGFGSTIIMALARSLPVFVLGMGLYGFTTFVTVPLNSYITHARGRWSVGRALTIISASFNFGVILGPLIGGWIGDYYGLRYTFLIAAVIFLVSNILIFMIRAQPVEKPDEASEMAGWKSLINPRFIQYLLLVLFVTFTLYLPQPLSQNFLQNQRGLDLQQIGQLIAARSVGIVILSLVVGQLNARVGYLISQACMAVFTLFIWRGTGMPWYFIGYFLLGSYQTGRTLAIAQGRTLLQSAYMGIGYAFLDTAMTISIILAPPIAGYLYEINPSYIYSVSLFLILLAIIVTKLLSPIKSVDMAKGD